MHIHATKGRPTAKFWLYPNVSVAYNRGFPSRVQSELIRVIEEHKDEIEDAWNEHFS
ncbi:MAG: hypothetical protein QOJ27_1287 [Sphingomonadales bacterium]|nr:hypothetical protein [Sphingomonadales bacterium]